MWEGMKKRRWGEDKEADYWKETGEDAGSNGGDDEKRVQLELAVTEQLRTEPKWTISASSSPSTAEVFGYGALPNQHLRIEI